MKVNFNQSFKNFDGTDIYESYEVVEKEKVDGKDQEVTKVKSRPKLISATIASILFVGKECKNVDEKMQSFALSQRIYNSKSAIEINVDEAAFIKRMMGDSLVAGAYAQVVNLLEDNTKK